jgi:hypothetical protein
MMGVRAFAMIRGRFKLRLEPSGAPDRDPLAEQQSRDFFRNNAMPLNAMPLYRQA